MTKQKAQLSSIFSIFNPILWTIECSMQTCHIAHLDELKTNQIQILKDKPDENNTWFDRVPKEKPKDANKETDSQAPYYVRPPPYPTILKPITLIMGRN